MKKFFLRKDLPLNIYATADNPKMALLNKIAKY